MEPIVRSLGLVIVWGGGLGALIFLSASFKMWFDPKSRERREQFRTMEAEVNRIAREQPIDADGNDWRILTSRKHWSRFSGFAELVPGMLCVSAAAAGVYATRTAGQDWQAAGIISLCAGALLVAVIGWYTIRAIRTLQRVKGQGDGGPENLSDSG